MNRREFILRGVQLAAAFGTFPSGLTLADVANKCPRCGGDHSGFSAMATRERAKEKLACWWRKTLNEETYKALTAQI